MYIPRRDHRFYYVSEAVEDVELHSCIRGCKRADLDVPPEDAEFPSGTCDLMMKIIMEEPVEEIDDRGDEGLFCTVREPLEKAEQNENQGELF